MKINIVKVACSCLLIDENKLRFSIKFNTNTEPSQHLLFQSQQ